MAEENRKSFSEQESWYQKTEQLGCGIILYVIVLCFYLPLNHKFGLHLVKTYPRWSQVEQNVAALALFGALCIIPPAVAGALFCLLRKIFDWFCAKCLMLEPKYGLLSTLLALSFPELARIAGAHENDAKELIHTIELTILGGILLLSIVLAVGNWCLMQIGKISPKAARRIRFAFALMTSDGAGSLILYAFSVFWVSFAINFAFLGKWNGWLLGLQTIGLCIVKVMVDFIIKRLSVRAP